MTTKTTEHGSFTVTRTYPVAPERVFAAWSTQEAKARWFGSPGSSDLPARLPCRRLRVQPRRTPGRSCLHLRRHLPGHRPWRAHRLPLPHGRR